jgi:hypothetical protein
MILLKAALLTVLTVLVTRVLHSALALHITGKHYNITYNSANSCNT